MSKKKKLRISMTQRETGLGWVYLVFELLLLPTLLRLLNSLLPVPLSGSVLNFIFFCLNFGFILGIFHSFLEKSLAAAGKNFWEFLQAVVLGFVAYWVVNAALGTLIAWVYPGFSNVNDQSIAAQASSHYVLMVIGTVILVPTVEEVLFRGLVFGSLHRRSRAWAYGLSTLVFCAIHVSSYIRGYEPKLLLLCFLQYVPAGLCLAWAYEKADSIFAPILIHTAVNAIGIYTLR